MARDTGDQAGVIPHTLGDLFDVDDAAVPADKSTLVWSAADTEFKKVAPSAAIADLTAISGGESPTEAEHNALRTAINSILAALRSKGIVAAS